MVRERQGFGVDSASLGPQADLPTSWDLFHHLENGDNQTYFQGMGRPHSPRRAGAQWVHWKCLAHRGIISGVPHVTPSRDPLSPPDRREVKSQLERACSCLTEPPSSSDPGTCIGPYGSHEPLLRLLPFLECLPYSQHFPSEGLFSESHHASPWRLDPSQPVPLPHYNLACGVHPHSCPQRWTQLRWGH